MANNCVKITSTAGISAAGGLSAGKTSYFADKVGIGTTSPARDLSIVGSGANALLQIANCDTGSTSDNG